MIRRETDAALINAISNASGIREWVCYRDGEMDWSPAVEGCMILSNGGDAVAAFEETSPRIWQAHTLFGPTCRGRRAIETARAMLAYMFAEHADVLWGATPMNNPKARWFNRQIGAIVVGQDHYPVEGLVEIFEVRPS